MSSLVDLIASNLEPLLPFRVVMSYELGVGWTLGKNPRPLDPGIHLRIPMLHTVEKVTAVEQQFNLPTQSVVTSDGVAVVFSVNFGVIVEDSVKHFCEVQDFDDSVRSLAMQHLSKRVRSLTYVDLIAGLDKLEASLKNTLDTRLKGWGARVTNIGFTDFVKVEHQIRLFQDQLLPA